MSDEVLIALIAGATTALATIATMIVGLVQVLRKLEVVHQTTNSKMDQLIETTATAAKATGKLEEAQEERVRRGKR